MQLKIVVHEAEEGGFWAEAPALPGCASQGETFDEVMHNMREAVDGWLQVDPRPSGRRSHRGACRVRTLAGRDFARLVERHGWSLPRVSGSHHIYGKPRERARLSIPIHGSTPLKKGLLSSHASAADLLEQIAD